jgi:hypothetical protein
MTSIVELKGNVKLGNTTVTTGPTIANITIDNDVMLIRGVV